MTVAEVLREARSLVDTPEKWWQRNGHNDSGELPDCDFTCVGLAVLDAGSHASHATLASALCRAIGITPGSYPPRDIYDWNDAPERTHADVLAAFDKAIALAEAEEASCPR